MFPSLPSLLVTMGRRTRLVELATGATVCSHETELPTHTCSATEHLIVSLTTSTITLQDIASGKAEVIKHPRAPCSALVWDENICIGDAAGSFH